MTHVLEPIAVVSIACRLPQGLDSPGKLWNALLDRVDTSTEIPADRWSVDRFYALDESAAAKTYTRRANFMTQDVRTFDAAFFGISPREAEAMDPQQRIMLEVLWEAFENAGIAAPEQAGRRVGVYVGGFMLDHMLGQMSSANRSLIGQHTAAGMMMTMLSNRLSHAFDLRGPSLSIDTACSSSLVAFHYACQDIWRGDVELAVAGGVNVMMRPEYPIGMSKGHFISRDGRSKSFDVRADGYGRGEGAGVVLLKPLARALADGDPILALVEGTGANQDGRTNGISLPNGDAQRVLMRQVCAEAGVDPRTVDYVEAHGTGTAIGDPTEAGAIGEVYGAGREADRACVLGSIKSNIGHLEAAAGVAGIIKAVLTLMHRQAPALGNLQEPNPAIPFADLGLRLADRTMPLGVDGQPIRVAVNSFGYGGTNAHALLRSAEGLERPARAEAPASWTGPTILPVSARGPAALVASARAMRQTLVEERLPLADVLYTAARRRAHLSHRAAVIGRDREGLIEALDALIEGKIGGSVVSDIQPYQGRREPVLVMTGMGPQWWGMGQDLYAAEPLFRATLDHADAIFEKIAGFSILAEMLRDEASSKITETRFAQPANFMVQLGVATLLRDAGVVPGAIVGHSVGEVTSAHLAGVLTLEEALLVSYHRSRLQQRAAGTGAMLAVGLSAAKAQEVIGDMGDRVSIAAINAPTQLTLAGDEVALRAIALDLEGKGVFHRALRVEVPYHSPMMEPLKAELIEALAGLHPKAPSVPLYSTVTGERVTEPLYDGPYWAQNIREPVYFATAVGRMMAEGWNSFVEVGPHPVLASSLRECAKAAGTDIRVLETLRRGEPEVARVHRAVAATFAAGCRIDWSRHAPEGKIVQLPNYPWQRERLWRESERSVQEKGAYQAPLLGATLPGGTTRWGIELDQDHLAFLTDHVVNGMPIMPAAGYVEQMLEMSAALHGDGVATVLRQFDIARPLVLRGERTLNAVAIYDVAGRRARLMSVDPGSLDGGTEHATAELTTLHDGPAPTMALAELRAGLASRDPSVVYGDLQRRGLEYKDSFRTLVECWTDADGRRVLARVELPQTMMDGLDRFIWHPSLLDGCFQALMTMLDGSGITYLPTSIAQIRHYGRLPRSVWCSAVMTTRNERHIDCDLTLLDEQGRVLGTIRELRCNAAGTRPRTDEEGAPLSLQQLVYHWQRADFMSEPKRCGHWLVYEDGRTGFATEVAARIEAMGFEVIGRVRHGAAYGYADGRFTLRPGHAEDVAAMLEEVGALDGVAFFQGLDAIGDSVDPVGRGPLQALILLLQGLAALPAGAYRPRVHVVTRGAFRITERDRDTNPSQGTFNGFVRVAYNELEGLRCSTIDLDLAASAKNPHDIENLTQELLGDPIEDEVALRREGRFTSELTRVSSLSDVVVEELPLCDTLRLAIRASRQHDGVELREVVPGPLGADEIELRLEAFPIPANVLVSENRDRIDQSYLEVVGTVVAVGDAVKDLAVGDRVAGYGPPDLGTHLRGQRRSFHVVPVAPDLDAAALACGLAMHARAVRVTELAGLGAGDRVLVFADHMGLACAEAAIARGADVTLLYSEALQLNARTLGKYRNFEADAQGVDRAVASVTEGRGFDVLVAPWGWWSERLSLDMLAISGRLVDTDEVARPVSLPDHVGGLFRCAPRILVEQRPEAFAAALTAAVRLLAEGKPHVPDNLAISIADLSQPFISIPKVDARFIVTFETRGADLPVIRQDRVALDPDATYMVTGGLGGFGTKTATWLVDHGARHLVLVGRNGADTAEKVAFVAGLRAGGVSVLAAARDLADQEACAALLAEVDRDMPPLKGIFHAAAVIEDLPIGEIDPETLARVLEAKALSAWHLHRLTLDRRLDLFVLYSSVAVAIGNSRQSMYCAANGFLDSLAWHRRARGLAATTVNWGVISDVGVVKKDERLARFLRFTGIRGLASDEALSWLEPILSRSVTQIGVLLMTSWGVWAGFEVLGATSKRFERLVAANSGDKDESIREQLRGELAKLEAPERRAVLSGLLAEIVAAEIKANAADVALDRPFSEIGVDSLMATQIQLTIESNLGLKVSSLELMGDGSILAMTDKLLASIGLAGDVETSLAIAS